MSDLPGSQGSGGAVSLEALARTSNCAKPQPKLRHHPLADLFPMMQGQSSTDFCIALQSDGRLLDEIVMLDGMILDGRNWQRACNKAGLRPRYRALRADLPA
jgi:hypothetical protein